MKIKRTLCFAFLSFAVTTTPVFAGSNYELEYDRFKDNKVASYDLSLGNECRLTKKIRSTLFACKFVASRTDDEAPAILLVSVADGWEIMFYRDLPPYSKNQAPAIITYKNGTIKKTTLPTISIGKVQKGGIVMETVMPQLGRIAKNLMDIESIELKYGSHEYYLKLDEALTKKALKYQN